MLAFEVEFLAGRFWACDYRDRTRPEWPPHPSRFYSALVAAAHAGSHGEQGRRALRWLEEQAPPEIMATDYTSPRPHVVYVPVNDAAGALVLPNWRLRQPRTFPCATPVVPKVYLIWPRAQAPDPVRETLAAVAGSVSTLGSSRSPVAVTLLRELPRLELPTYHHYVPADAGELTLRVAGPGRLDELERLFALGRRPTPGPMRSYTEVREAPPPPLPASHFGRAFVFRRTSGPPVPIEAALTLAAVARDSVLAAADPVARPYLEGKTGMPHCAWVPLPFVGHKYADGRLLGIAVLLPHGLKGPELQALHRSLLRLSEVPLPGAGAVRFELITAATPPYLVPRSVQWHAWSSPSRRWTSVTPVLLDRFPRAGKQSAADVIGASCVRIGLPEPEAVEVSRYSRLAGVPPADAFRTRFRAGAAPRPAVHVTVQFSVPVRGPIVLGAGRYLGLGLLRPIDEVSQQ